MVINGEWCFWWCMKVLSSRWLNGLDGPRLLDHHLEGRVRWLELGPCTGFQRSVSFTNGGFLRRSSSPIPFRREKLKSIEKQFKKTGKKHVCKIYLERCFNEEGQLDILDQCLMSLKRESWEILTVNNCRKTIICNVSFSGAHVKTMESWPATMGICFDLISRRSRKRVKTWIRSSSSYPRFWMRSRSRRRMGLDSRF